MAYFGLGSCFSAGYIYTPQPLLEGGGTGKVPVGPVGPSAFGKVTHYGWEAALGRTETDGAWSQIGPLAVFTLSGLAIPLRSPAHDEQTAEVVA